MADDDTGETSSPWGRSRRTPGQPTPAPGSIPPGGAGTPAPPSAPPGTPAPPGYPAPPSGPYDPAAPSGPFSVPGTPPPAPSGPFPAPGTPAPPPFSLDKADPPATTAIPAGQWESPPTSPPGYGAGGYGGTPPPGYGGYPPGGPVPAKKGSGAVIALVAVGLVALLLVGAVVALVLLSGDDDEPDRASDSDTTQVSAPTTVPPDSTELPPETAGPDSTEAPPSTDAPATSAPVPTPSLPTPGISKPPEGFPDPAGATDSVTGGIEVPGMDAQQVADFYEAQLPGAGYTVDQTQDVGGIFVLTISGPENGILTITAFDPLPTTVIWSGL